MRDFLERLGAWFPALIALALPTLFVPTVGAFPSAVDAFILPRASLVVGGACLLVGLALLTPGGSGLGALRWPMIAASAAAGVAFLFSVSWPVSLAGSYTRYESLPVRLSYLGLLAGTVWLLRGGRARQWVVPAFVFGTAVASLEAFAQWAGSVPFRPDGNLGNANLLAALVAMALPLALARGLRIGDTFVVAWWLAVPALVVGLLVTTSRSGDLGALAGCLALATFLTWHRFHTTPRLATALALASAAIVGVAVTAINFSPLSRLNDDPPSLRLHLWQDGIHMVLARPLTGWGEDTTGLAFGQFLSHDYAQLVTFDRIHSGPLDIAATQGILGLAALGWLLFVLFQSAWRTRFPNDAAGLAAALVGYSVWVLFNFDWVPATGAFWLLAGTMWSWIRSEQAGAVTGYVPIAAGVRAGWARSLAAIGVALGAVVLAAMPMLADVWYFEGRPDLSVKVDPLQARYHWAYGDALTAQGSPDRGVTELELAASFGETEPGLYVDLGDVQARLGRYADARAAYHRALAIDPYYTPASERLANLKG